VASRFTYDRAQPFLPGRRRIVRFRVPPGTAVRAPCRGPVSHAGRVPGGRGVTVRCGAWSVTLTGVDPRTVRGRRVGRGTTVATAAAATGRAAPATARAQPADSSVGLGVRLASDAFGYVDPLPLLRDPEPAEPFSPVGPAPRVRPMAPAVAPAARRVPALRPAPAGPVPATAPVPGPDALRPALRFPVTSTATATATATAAPATPLLAWVGLAVAALGVPAGAVGLRVRRRERRRASAVASRGTA